MDPDLTNPYKSASPDDKQRWIVIYPAYMDAKKTKAEGRRIGRSKCVDVPQTGEIKDICTSLGLAAEIEAKQYPREHARDNLHSGRVRVQLRQASGSPVVPEIQSRKDLLVKVGELIPKLKTRQSRSSGDSGASAASGTNKKKGKKK